jgi:hypothetical protein
MCCPLTFNRIHCFLRGLQKSVDNCRDNNASSGRYTTSNEWENDAKGNGTDMVRWYNFDICKILISLRINEFFSFRDVGSVYLIVVAWCGQLVKLSVLISLTQLFVLYTCNFVFLMEGDYLCLAIFPVIRLSRFYLVTLVISVRLEWNILFPRFQTSPHSWSVWQLLPPLEIVWYYLVVFSVLPRVQFRSEQ